MTSMTFHSGKKRCRMRFTAPDGSTRCLSVSQGKKETKKEHTKRAHALSANLEKLIECRATGNPPDNGFLKWVGRLKPRHRKTLVESKLIEDVPHSQPDSTNGEPMTLPHSVGTDWRIAQQTNQARTWSTSEHSTTLPHTSAKTPCCRTSQSTTRNATHDFSDRNESWQNQRQERRSQSQSRC